MRRPPPLLTILGASAVTLAALTGLSDCGGPKDTAHSGKPKHATAQLEFGNTINYGAFGTNTQVNCEDGKSLNVGGSNNTLTVRGRCESVNILGADNRLIVDDVDRTLTIAGLNNSVTYRRGDPKIEDHGSGNTIAKR